MIKPILYKASSMSRIKRITPFLIIFVSLTSALVLMGKQSEKYASDTMISTGKAITQKFARLHQSFGSVPHFYKALEQAVVKDGYTVTDLLILDETAVRSEMAQEYASSTTSLTNLEPMMHIHKHDAGMSYVVGGYPLLGIEAIEGSENVAVFFGPVRKSVVKRLEQQLDGDTADNKDSTGQLRFNRHDTMNGQYIVGMYL